MAKKTNTEINGQKYYKVTRTIGHKEDGTPIKKQFYGSGINEANEKANNYIDNINSGMTIDYRLINIDSLVHTWLYDIKLKDRNFKPNSFSRYESIYRNYIKTNIEFCSLKVFNCRTLVIQKFYNELSKEGKTESQIKNLNKVLKGAFRYAVQEGYCTKNPCEYVVIPKKEENIFDEVDNDNLDFDFFDKEDLVKIITECKNRIDNNDTDYFPYLVLFSLFSGLRLGEATGLQIQYFHNNIVNVRKELVKIKIFKDKKFEKYEYRLTKTKTKNSIRDVSIASSVFDIIEKYINTIVKEIYKNNNKIFDDNSLIFVNSNCRFIDQSNLRRKWQNFLKYLNIDFKKWHRLRAGYACLLFDEGVDIKTVQELLGHSDINTTINIYLKIFPKAKKESVNVLNQLLSS